MFPAHNLQRAEREKATCVNRTSGFSLLPNEQLVERLNAGLYRKLTLISAPAGLGKTTLRLNLSAGSR